MVEIIDENKANSVGNPNEVCLRISLSKDNELKFPIQMLYHKEKGFRKFLLEYDFNFLNGFEKTISKIKDPLYNLLDNHNLEIYISGFPRCIFETMIMNSEEKWKYDNKLIFYEKEENINTNPEEKSKQCGFCICNNICRGLPQEYFEKGITNPLISNETMSEIYDEKLSNVFETELLEIAKEILKDYKKDKGYNEKDIYIGNNILLEKNSNQEIKYQIKNSKENFQDNLKIIEKLINSQDLEMIKSYLEKSPLIILSFEKDKNENIKKEIFFSMLNHNENEISEITSFYGFNNNPEEIEGINIIFDSNGNEIESQIILKHKQIKNDEVKKEFEKFNLENKRALLKFLNSMIRPLKNITIAGNHPKKFNILTSDNNIKMNSIGILYQKRLNFLEECKVHSLSFEVSNNETEIVKVYYSCKFPIPIEEEFEELKPFE